MIPKDLERLKELQRRLEFGDVVIGGVRREPLSKAEQAELDALRLKIEPELPDDPTTLFVDEARRPLADGRDFLTVYEQEECQKASAFALELASRVGEAVARVALQGALEAIKGR